MKPNIIHRKLQDFIEFLKKDPVHISVAQEQTGMFNRFMTEAAYQKKFGDLLDEAIKEVESVKGLVIDDDQQLAFSLFSAHLLWSHWQEGSVCGGFAFNEGYTMVMESLNRWRKSYQDFLEYAEEIPEQTALLSELLFFESPTHQHDLLFKPYYGCVLPNGKTFPHEFYFFDGGIIYPLPFKKYEDYILCLIANVGVECWQYFYIDPQLLVRKNRGVNYMTTDLRVYTQLVEDFSMYEYNPSYKFDRLDIIYERLKHYVKVLPRVFPNLDLKHQQVYLQKLELLM